MKRILFLGAGAIGSYLGGWLKHAGHDVTIIDPWADQVDKVNQDGIQISGPHENIISFPRMLHLHESEKLSREQKFEIGFIALKAYDTSWAAKFIDNYILEDGFIVSAQNCWPDPLIAEVVGEKRTIGLVMSNISAELYKPGKVSRPGQSRMRDQGHDVFRAGEHNGEITNRAKELIEILDPIDSGRVTNNLWGERWAKLGQNCMGNPVVAMSNMGTAELASDYVCRCLQINLAKEASIIGIKLGYNIDNFGGSKVSKWSNAEDKDVYSELDGMIARRSQGPNRHPSMAQDVIKGRVTEIRFMNGYVLQKAIEIGIDIPATKATINMILKIDSGEVKPSRDNIDIVLKEAGITPPNTV
jgi:2-dehydropantoate 2-reductase